MKLILLALSLLALQNPALAGGLDSTELDSGSSPSIDHGNASASGDFNGDGFGDLAIGDPGFDDGRGRVLVYFGTATGLSSVAGDTLSIWDHNTADPDEAYGAALAVGDFNGDGWDDLAIGAPGEKIGGVACGRVHVRLGVAPTVPPAPPVYSMTGAHGSFQYEDVPYRTRVAGDEFGGGLAAGDMNGDGFDDLLVGVPGRESHINGTINVGEVAFVPGGIGGLDESSSKALYTLVDQADTRMGEVLAVVDTAGDGYADAWAGVPTWEVDGHSDAGVLVKWGSNSSGPLAWGKFYAQGDLAGGTQVSEAGDLFGAALAGGNFTCDGAPWLAVGSPFKGRRDGRLFYIRFDSSGAMEHNDHGFHLGHFTPGVTQYAWYLGADLAVGDFDGDGCDDLVSSNFANAVSLWMGAPLSHLPEKDQSSRLPKAFPGTQDLLLPSRSSGSWPSPQSDIIPMTAFSRESDTAQVYVDTVTVGPLGDEIVVIAKSESPTDETFVSVAAPDEPMDPRFFSTDDMSFHLRSPSGAVAATRLADERRYNASTTKMILNLAIMSAAADPQNALDLTQSFTITAAHLPKDPYDCSLHGSSVGLEIGDTISWTDLRGFTTVRSAGDAAYAAAVELSIRLGGDANTDTAMQAMNDYAAAHGLQDTWFVNPTGRDAPTWWANDYGGPNPGVGCVVNKLDTEQMVFGDDCSHFSTARDLAKASWLIAQEPTLADWSGAGRTSFTPTWQPRIASPALACASGGNRGKPLHSVREYGSSNTLLGKTVILPNGATGSFVGTKTGTRWTCAVAFAVQHPTNGNVWHGALLGADDMNASSPPSCDDERVNDVQSAFSNIP